MKSLTQLQFGLLILLSCNSNKSIKSDLISENLNGSIKSFTEIQYKAIEKFGEIEKGEILTESTDHLTGIYEVNFNIQGDIILEVSYNSNGSIYSKTQYVFNTKGVKFGANTYNAENKLDGMELLTYDENNNLIDYSILNADSSLYWRYKNKFDRDGNKIESMHYNSEGMALTKELYKFDSNGHRIEWTTYAPNGDYQSQTNYINDKNGNVVEVTMDFPALENSFGNIAPTYFNYTYDKTGNWIKKIEYSGSNRTPKTITERKIIYY